MTVDLGKQKGSRRIRLVVTRKSKRKSRWLFFFLALVALILVLSTQVVVLLKNRQTFILSNTSAIINGNTYNVAAGRFAIGDGELILVKGSDFLLKIQYPHSFENPASYPIGESGVQVTYSKDGVDWVYTTGTLKFSGVSHLSIVGQGEGWELNMDITFLDNPTQEPPSLHDTHPV